MAVAALESNKTKIAKRMIEVFEFFALGNDSATVMDIVRHYDRPQSSTSELLGSLVEMGLLYKDPFTRAYSPTPRLAALGAAAQPEPIGSGRLFSYMDRLAHTSRHGVGLFGMVGTHAQIFRWSRGGDGLDERQFRCGAGTLLSSGAIGLLLLSSLGLSRASKTLWRLNAEADADARLDLAAVNQQVARFGQFGQAAGPSGFAPDTRAAAVLLPDKVGERRRLALGVIYRSDAAVDPEALLATLEHGVRQCLAEEGEAAPSFMRSIAAV